MRKMILLIVAIAGMQSLSAQNDTIGRTRQVSLNIHLVQHIGIDKWSDTKYVNNGLPPASITEIRGVLDCPVKPMFNLFFDMGLGIMPAPAMKSFTLDGMPMPNNGTNYYLREILSESGRDKASVRFKMTAGWFGDFQVGKELRIMPYLGVGGLTMARRSYKMVLKEEGSNMQYYTTYAWGRDYDDDDDSKTDMLGYLTGRLNFQTPINSKVKLSFGLEYTYFFNAMNFYGRYSNAFNGNIQREFVEKGNNMSMFGISVSLLANR